MKKKIYGFLVLGLIVIISITGIGVNAVTNAEKNPSSDEEMKLQLEEKLLTKNLLKEEHEIDRSQIEVIFKDEDGNVIYETNEEDFIKNQDKILQDLYSN